MICLTWKRAPSATFRRIPTAGRPSAAQTTTIALGGGQTFNDSLDVGDAVERGHEHGVAHRDDRDLVESDRRDQRAAVASQERIAGIQSKDIALADIVILVLRSELPDGIP